MFPNTNYLPAGLSQGCSHKKIPALVSGYFGLPIADIRLWHFKMAGVAMPKVRVDKYCNFLSSEENVGLTEDCLGVGGEIDMSAF